MGDAGFGRVAKDRLETILVSIDTAAAPLAAPLRGETTGLIGRIDSTLSIVGSLMLSLALSILLTAGIESVQRGSFSETLAYFSDPMRPAWATVGVFMLLFLALDGLFGRAHYASLVLAPIALLPALISKQKQIYLSDPLYPTDFLFGRQIMELMPVLVRDRPWTAAGMAVGIVLAVAGLTCLLVFAWRRFPRLTHRERLGRLVFAVPLIAGFVHIMDFNQFSWLRDRLNIIPMMWDQTENYRHNGFTMAFALNLPMANVSAPAGYMGDAINGIETPIVPAGTTHRGKPDVIVIMSESLFDPTRLPNVTFSADPMPTMRAIQSGNIMSPEFGGMTANVEFEALTGFSNAFLPYGSIPYQQYIRDPIPSLATFFKGEGYVSRAIHPFQSWFWNRSAVYKAFGFDTFRSEEKLPAMTKRGIFTSDEALTKEIMRQADEWRTRSSSSP